MNLGFPASNSLQGERGRPMDLAAFVHRNGPGYADCVSVQLRPMFRMKYSATYVFVGVQLLIGLNSKIGMYQIVC